MRKRYRIIFLNTTCLQVDSNDKLYGQNKKYLAQVDELLQAVLEKIISYLDAIGQCRPPKKFTY